MAATLIRRGTALAATGAVAGALLFASATPAAAGGDDAVLTATRGGVSPTAAAADVIRCTLRVHQPHYSHHAHAADKHRVNVTADVKCTKRVARLRIKVRLYKNGQPYKTTGWKSNSGKNWISYNAARRCVKRQRYQGQAWAQVVFPPGYRPPAAAGTVKSRVVTINRCTR
ncbi:hypothetical protein Arub01_41160 [Actinomadura rubrobrunea]|uniref:Secreted protein n=1 Tax=Actinomadura rubrobrunea TaxID=115335 RepID=A0A9W6PY06_9ACTN|nr:hypothetical protein [Actinomadura rubrobrunea]GLW65872.1 hypothetical protein Arub01_41160 [Actinomadura rubrobrunea]